MQNQFNQGSQMNSSNTSERFNQPNEKKQIPTWLGILIIVLVSILLFGGVFAWQYYAKISNSQFQISNENQNAQPAQSPSGNASGENPNSETAGWKTYTNTQYGYEIKYPSDWIFNDDPSYSPIVHFCGPEYKTIRDCGFAGKGGTPVISLRNDSLDITAINFCAENSDNVFCGENILKSNIEIDGRNASIIEFKDTNSGTTTLWKQNTQDNKMFEFGTTVEYRDVFDKMLFTFKFTN